MPRHATHSIRPTQRRLLALWALIDQPSKSMDAEKINTIAGFIDERVLLLSMAECAMYGLVSISDGLITITDKGVIYAQENIHTIKAKDGSRITWTEATER